MLLILKVQLLLCFFFFGGGGEGGQLVYAHHVLVINYQIPRILNDIENKHSELVKGQRVLFSNNYNHGDARDYICTIQYGFYCCVYVQYNLG